MPLVLSRPNDAAKMAYLQSLFAETYLKDIIERKNIRRKDILDAVVDLLCSSVGSLTTPTNVTNSLNTKRKLNGENTVALNTVKSYMDYLADAFLQELF